MRLSFPVIVVNHDIVGARPQHLVQAQPGARPHDAVLREGVAQHRVGAAIRPGAPRNVPARGSPIPGLEHALLRIEDDRTPGAAVPLPRFFLAQYRVSGVLLRGVEGAGHILDGFHPVKIDEKLRRLRSNEHAHHHTRPTAGYNYLDMEPRVVRPSLKTIRFWY